MAVRVGNDSPELFDSFLASPPKKEVLRQLEGLVDWQALRQLLLKAYSPSEQGQPGFDPVMLFKMLLLEHLYGLSDIAVVEETRDRLTFREFVGCGASGRVPDDTTLVVFRRRLRAGNYLEQALAEIHEQMAHKGLKVRSGSIKIVDASLIQAAVNKPPTPAAAPDRQTSEASPAAAPAPKDPDANCTVRKAQPFYGYKLHLAQDRETGLITRHITTPASVADIEMLQALIDGTESEVLADKGYCSRANRQWLSEQNITPSILHRGARNHPLNAQQIAENRELSKRRSFVEGAFASLKRFRRCGRAVYIGLLRVRDQMTMGVLVYNLMRFTALAQPKCA